jgi:hypothetical protein
MAKTSVLSSKILTAIGAEHGDSKELSRALTVAPQMIAAAGIQPVGRDTDAFENAIHYVLGEEGRKQSTMPLDELSQIADMVKGDLLKRGLNHDLASLAVAYMTSREDAAYSLGLAVGLTFARCLGGEPPVQPA